MTPSTCANPRHDHWNPVDALDDHAMPYDLLDVVLVDGQRVVPFACGDCGLPAHYDLDTDYYRHDDPAVACFLIPAGVAGSPCSTAEGAR